MADETLNAARELRHAVQHLARQSRTRQHEPEALRRAAALVTEAADLLDGEVMESWWQVDGDPVTDLRAYRHRSIYQGALHPFSSAVRWIEADGPDGEPGRGFVVRVSDLFGGPPMAVHGGYVAGLFDELLGAVQGLTGGGTGYTAILTVRYRSMTPVDEDLTFRGWVTSDVGRRIHTHASCHAGDRLTAEAEGLFVRPRSQP